MFLILPRLIVPRLYGLFYTILFKAIAFRTLVLVVTNYSSFIIRFIKFETSTNGIKQCHNSILCNNVTASLNVQAKSVSTKPNAQANFVNCWVLRLYMQDF